jgi:hypothetical protein
MDDPDEPGVPTYVMAFVVIAVIGIATLWLLGGQVTTILSISSRGV